MIAQAALLVAVWVHLWAQHATCPRYVFPLVLMSSGWAALGLLRLSAWTTVFFNAGSLRWSGLLRAAPAAAVGAIALAAAFSWNCGPRAAKVELGRWIRSQAGPSPVLFGPNGFTQVVNYYARGRCVSFLATADAETVSMLLAQCRPNVVVLPQDEAARDGGLLVRLLEGTGLQGVDPGRLPKSCGCGYGCRARRRAAWPGSPTLRTRDN